MDKNRVWAHWHKALPLAILLAFSVSPARSDVRLPFPSVEGGKNLRYCSSASKAGAALCTKMCDPAEYQGHSPVKSCESNQQKVRIMAPLPSHTTSKKNNKVQAASL